MELVTVTGTHPAGCAGETAVTWVSASTLKLVALRVPNFTDVAPVKPLPAIFTVVPPAVVPVLGLREEMEGMGK